VEGNKNKGHPLNFWFSFGFLGDLLLKSDANLFEENIQQYILGFRED
jgi:hypothetical protein